MKNQKGITLIALVITIIVLLILAGVSIAMLLGDNGILTNATEAQENTAKQNAVEKINVALQAIKTEALSKIVGNSNYDPANDASLKTAEITGIDTTDETEYTVEGTSKITITYTNTTYNITVSGDIDFSGTNKTNGGKITKAAEKVVGP